VNGRYAAPLAAGYSITMKPQSLQDYEFPSGREWRGTAGAAPAGPASAVKAV
jgi:hypothetical protein